MTYDWNRYIIFARILAGRVDEVPDEQTKFRNAVSRSYFAAYNIARIKKFEVDGLPLPGSDEHKWVSDFYKDYDEENGTSLGIGDYLQDVKAHRRRADYKEEESITEGIIEYVLEMADCIIQNTRLIQPHT